jgi:hypothetical protein
MNLGYTPELTDYHARTLRRIAWALGRPMTKTIEVIFDSLDLIIDPQKVCEKCKDKSKCDECYFKRGWRVHENLSLDPIKLGPVAVKDMVTITREVEMKVNQVSVLVSKKIGKNFSSWSISYGATADVEEEHFTEAIAQLDTQLREMVSSALPTPNGNGHRPNGAADPECNENNHKLPNGSVSQGDGNDH